MGSTSAFGCCARVPSGGWREVTSVSAAYRRLFALKKPLKIPAGSTIKAVGSYDNSTRNVNNAEPHKEVY